jgi:hypothetical protein
MQMSGQGMADGGAVRGFAEGKKVEGGEQDTSKVPSLAEVLYLLGGGLGVGAEVLKSPVTIMQKAGEYGPTLGELGSVLAAGARGEEAPEISGVFERRPEESTPPEPTPTPTPNMNVGIAANMPGGVARARTAAEQPKPSPTGNPDLDAAIEAMRAESDTGIQRVGVEEDSGLGALLKRRLEDGFVDTARTDAETRAREAYAVPEEQRELYRKRGEALNRPLYTPEEERMRALQGLLAGLASSGYIAESGPAAMQGVNEVRDAVRQDELARAEQQFNLSDQLMGMDRTASIEAFGAGLEASNAAMAQQGDAMTATASMLNAAGQREQAALIQESQNRMATLQIQAEAISKAAQAGQDVTSSLVTYAETLRRSIQDADTAMSDILEASGPGMALPPESQAALQTLRDQRNILNRQYSAVTGRVGSRLGVNEVIDYTSL